MGKMVASKALFYAVAVVAVVLGDALAASEISQVKIWPMPASVSYGDARLYLTSDFGLSSDSESQILKDAFNRMLAVIKQDHVIDADFSAFNRSSLLQGLHIVVSSPDEQLQYGTDESYKLMVPSPEKPGYAHLEAKTVYGALHGLQTFSQLCYFSIGRRVLEVNMSPWTIIDQPRFPFRGLLIDTSRHYLPMAVIKKVIDSMSYAKLNVLHWHIVDTQSFPLEIPSYPKLWDGAYSLSERYSAADAAEVSALLTTATAENHFFWLCFSCEQLKRHRMNESQAYQYFVLRAQKIALSHGYEIVNWEETFNDFGSKLSRKTVVHNWLGGGVAQRVVESGLRCIVSNQDKWYLDHLDTPWEEFYQNEPLTNITNPKQQKLVIGGEVCMWGETVDGSDIEQTIWPRAAAAAERLWTPYDKLAKNPREVTGRLANFRCLLNERGVAAAPLAGNGRDAPFGPGSCYKQ
ncbi:hypothetical protein V6N12_014600 [Hibiscus sabdariffa]|uniref:beta-N-acetylhexosaminidase n=2 Tax=Hibiscus sabdariffa TaxID=183260 RepID=A0ABR2DL21_9ROSI